MSKLEIIALAPALFAKKPGRVEISAHIKNGAGVELVGIATAQAIITAASRAGEAGVIDLEFVDLSDEQTRAGIAALVKRIHESHHDGAIGIRCNVDQLEFSLPFLVSSGTKSNIVVLVPNSTENKEKKLQAAIKLAKKNGIKTLVEIITVDEAIAAERCGAHQVIAKGHEAGGRVGHQTSFVLLQECLSKVKIPVVVHGGIGLHTAAACYAAGARGVVLDSQLLFTKEAGMSFEVSSKLARLDGTETIFVQTDSGVAYRFYLPSGHRAAQQLNPLLESEGESPNETKEAIPFEHDFASLRSTIIEYGSSTLPNEKLFLIGQDIAFALNLAKKYRTVSGVIDAINSSVAEHLESSIRLKQLDENSSLAKSHNTRYPIVQGAMTRVSDTAEFALAVAQGGALPFLALALMRKGDVEQLLSQCRENLGTLSWGVGILGFVPQQLRQEQFEIISKYKPPYALIAGGRPDQAKAFEDLGIKTYLHVPSPLLLDSFIEMGSRRFIFEGKECGGHTGPRSSFVLWESMIERLLAAIGPREDASVYHVIFAGGIHDKLSSAMVAAMSATLAARGVRVGVLMGTAYLFTEEAVKSGAIVKTFQDAAIKCKETVLLETGPGHTIRCINSPYKNTFDNKRKELLLKNTTRDQIREELELMNLGRLRIASKGLTRKAAPQKREDVIAELANENNDSNAAKKETLITLASEEQWSQGMYMIGQVASMHNSTCTVEQLHKDVSINASKLLEDRFSKHEAAVEVVSPKQKEPQEAIAIVGMSCLFPKANDLETYWQNILNKVDTITEVPKEHWDWEKYYDENIQARDRISSKWGGFLGNIRFKPTTYGIPPSSVQSIDPMQLMLLEVTRAALEDAGYAERSFSRDRTAVILANAGHGPVTALYSLRSMLGWKLDGLSQPLKDEIFSSLPEWTEDSFAGYLGNVAAGRISNRYDLGGMNFAVDAACASSLAALYVAMSELRQGKSDIALLGAVDTHNQPGDYLSFSKTYALSPRGRCRTFDATADGIVLSEGVAMLVLKRLADAERDGDKIYALIRGIGSSSDGRDLSLTAPRPAGQMLALNRAYEDAGISPATVTLVEAHGTGTVAGDKAEIEALKQVFENSNARPRACAVGSVKTMIGHTKAAAGLASLIKVSKALYHQVLPPTIGVNTPNPSCNFEQSPFYINSESRPWLSPNTTDHKRRAGVSAFGFGGTNFHAVLEEYTASSIPSNKPASYDWPAELFALKAKTKLELIRAIDALNEQTKRVTKDAELTASLFRKFAFGHHLKHSNTDKASEANLAIVATTFEDLQDKLQRAKGDLINPSCSEIKDPRGVYFRDISSKDLGKIAFLFPGQGSQQVNMLRDLTLQFPEIRTAYEHADKILAKCFDRALSSYVFPPPAFSKEQESQQLQELTNTHVAQPAIGVADFAMFQLMESFGIKADMTAGHSYGEYVALAAAGVMNEESLLKISESRGRILSKNSSSVKGTMAAVSSDAAQVKAVLAGATGVCIANINAPNQIVIAGSSEDVEKAIALFKDKGIQARLIPVSQAFHSPYMAHAESSLKEALSEIKFDAATIPVYSNTHGDVYPVAAEAIKQRLAQHITSSVDFVKELSAMHSDGARIFVEVGPGTVLSSLADSILKEKDCILISLDRSGRNGIVQLLHALAQLFSLGVAVNINHLFTYRCEDIGLDALELTPSNEKTTGNMRGLTYLIDSAHIQLLDQSKSAPATNKMSTSPQIKVKTENIGNVKANNQSDKTMGNTTEIKNTVPKMAPAPAKVQQSTTNIPAQAPSVKGKQVDQVMLQFQQTMLQMTQSFLETQQQVMLAYLGAKNTQQVGGDQTNIAPLNFQPDISQLNNVVQSMQSQVITNAPAQNSTVSAAPVAAAPAVIEEIQADSHSEQIKESNQELSTDELINALLDIVSQRTGYPPEMLDPTLDLEADLGIDSIKRVEILNSFRKILPESKQKQLESGIEELAGTKTLAGIMDWLRSAPAEATDEDQPAPVVAASVSEPAHNNGHDGNGNGNGHDGNGHDGNGKRQIAARIAAAVNQGSTAKISDHRDNNNGHKHPVEAEKAASSVVRRGIVKSVELPPVEPGDAFNAKKLTLITDDGQGIAPALARLIEERGGKTLIIKHSTDNHKSTTAEALVDLSNLNAVQDFLASAKSKLGEIGSLIHLLPVNLKGSSDIKAISNDDLSVISLFVLLKALESELNVSKENQVSIVSTTTLGGVFGTDSNLSANAAMQAGTVGILKSIAKEWSGTKCKAIDFALDIAPTKIAELVFAELAAGDQHIEVGYQKDKRVGLEIVPEAISPGQKSNSALIDSSSVVLITGGARGITAEIALELAARHKPTFVIVGKAIKPTPQEDAETHGLVSPKELKASIIERLKREEKTVAIATVEKVYQRLLKEREIRQTLTKLEELGAHVDYRAVDVSDDESFAMLIENIYGSYGKIDGVIHGAGIIEDAYVKDKQLDSFERVFRTKVRSALTLVHNLKLDQLKFITLFSSVVGRTGNAGQTDYVAGNEVLNKLALLLDKHIPGRVASLMWGPWKAGMAQPELESLFAKYGWAMIDRTAGRQSFIEELESGKKGQVEILLVAELAEKNKIKGRGARLNQTEAIKVGPSAYELTVSLSPSQDLYLNDHTFDGIPVMPMAMSLELMAEAIASVYPDWELLKIHNFDIPSGIVFESSTKQISISLLEETKNESSMKVSVSVGTGAPKRRVNFKAVAELVKPEVAGNIYNQLPVGIHPQISSLEDLDHLKDTVAPPIVSDIYGRWLFHGPLFQGIKSVMAMGTNGVLGEINISDPKRCLTTANGDGWVIDPILLDSGMQLAGIWARQYLDMTVLPTGFKTFYRCAPLDGSTLTARVYINEGANARELTCNLAAYRSDGKLVFLVEGLAGVGSKSLNRLAKQETKSSSAGSAK